MNTEDWERERAEALSRLASRLTVTIRETADALREAGLLPDPDSPYQQARRRSEADVRAKRRSTRAVRLRLHQPIRQQPVVLARRTPPCNQRED